MQQLLVGYPETIYYFSNDTSTAEIDFCIEAGTLVPIEVKGGRHLTAKSILSYLKHKQGERGLRFSDKRPQHGETIDDLPLYVACCFARQMAQRKTMANTVE